ncbi:GNAT family N-acetyltransferase [Amycolatopsis saalfeldensis]|uniref:L-amino acid N-acyltransferase YncA n=1 Tax=Amycolatopsis saalfeldensis TaxID=394193 RepID=A0A1H8YGU3_9PSEU|nr:GNAT family N-acetyltransferase [Amycolatopsis saalfeldensis]SEP51434.1 L-amino acid N-acyltransferase YncA [Amycolatopsis saalfeldensis]
MTSAIRLATVADAAEIAAVHIGSWQAAYDGLLSAEFLAGLSLPARERAWTEALSAADSRHTVLVTSVDGAVTGFAAVGPSRDEDATPETGELSAIYLVADHWGRGAGRALHERAVAALAATFSTATLWVLSTNARARRFYERAGWSPEDRTKVETIANGTVTLDEVRYRLSLRG